MSMLLGGFHRCSSVIDLNLQLHRFTHNDVRARQHRRNFRRIRERRLDLDSRN